MNSGEHTRAISTRIGAACALVGVGAIVVGIAVSWLGYQGYAPWLRYISELARPANPLGWAFQAGLVAAGVLFVPFGIALAGLLSGPRGVTASRLVMLAGPMLSLTGLFPLTSPVPHFACAAVMFASAIFAELYVARAITVMKDGGRLLFARRWALGMFWFHVVAAIGGFTYSAVATRHMKFTSASQMLVDAPPYQQLTLGAGGLTINPVAIMEWVFLLTALILPLGASLRLLGARKKLEHKALR